MAGQIVTPILLATDFWNAVEEKKLRTEKSLRLHLPYYEAGLYIGRALPIWSNFSNDSVYPIHRKKIN